MYTAPCCDIELLVQFVVFFFNWLWVTVVYKNQAAHQDFATVAMSDHPTH